MLENLIAWLILIGAPQYLIDERQMELDEVNAELDYLYNIGLLEWQMTTKKSFG